MDINFWSIYSQKEDNVESTTFVIPFSKHKTFLHSNLFNIKFPLINIYKLKLKNFFKSPRKLFQMLLHSPPLYLSHNYIFKYSLQSSHQ